MENKKLELLDKLFSCENGKELINVAFSNAEYLNTVLKDSDRDGGQYILSDYELILGKLSSFPIKNEKEDWAIDTLILFLQIISNE